MVKGGQKSRCLPLQSQHELMIRQQPSTAHWHIQAAVMWLQQIAAYDGLRYNDSFLYDFQGLSRSIMKNSVEFETLIRIFLVLRCTRRRGTNTPFTR